MPGQPQFFTGPIQPRFIHRSVIRKSGTAE
ncbi:hypothetical protein FRACA_780038 [Frankia canadensis]|uniref:Uncharacterized protein n=1 Tax=Frankia canadensis TaxID=1836972 RepID=A0A2I2L185_9ACTN|nr:hypothetical protein FRACA_780038 [Frankia canadensis]SOU58971.1 hypothetical protein FRACA_780038 [Frankia canadensis]